MNVFFWIIVILVLILVWFLLAFAFRGIGWLAMRIFGDAVDELTKEEKENKE